MTVSLKNNISAIVTDIEGTTSSISFVHDVLFPYASKELPDYIRQHAEDEKITGLLNDVRTEVGEPGADNERVTEVLLNWIREDRKATPLKALQGLVWEHGFSNADFKAHVYDDVLPNLEKWQQSGIELYVYSSGSIYAQKLFFGHSQAGNLLHLFKDYFDTTTGPKREPNSYRLIADAIGKPAEQVLFLSDIVEELDAAKAAGMQTLQLVREGTVITGEHAIVHDFNEIVF